MISEPVINAFIAISPVGHRSPEREPLPVETNLANMHSPSEREEHFHVPIIISVAFNES